ATQRKREKLAAQITWLINKHELQATDLRKHERIVPRNQEATLILGDGSKVICKILDVSVSGAMLETSVKLPIDSQVHIGKLRCRVVRHHEAGIAVQFADIQQPTALRRYFG
ncbi:MAG: PilZ domain-containing protein, partial [Hyphomicrobiaceae bacterium]